MIWFVLAHVFLWPGPDVEVEPPDAKRQQQVIEEPGNCQRAYMNCPLWTNDV